MRGHGHSDSGCRKCKIFCTFCNRRKGGYLGTIAHYVPIEGAAQGFAIAAHLSNLSGLIEAALLQSPGQGRAEGGDRVSVSVRLFPARAAR